MLSLVVANGSRSATLRAERPPLEAHIPYFSDLLKDIAPGDVEVSVKADPETFSWLIQYCYALEGTGAPPHITPENCLALLVSARFLGMHQLLEEALAFALCSSGCLNTEDISLMGSDLVWAFAERVPVTLILSRVQASALTQKIAQISLQRIVPRYSEDVVCCLQCGKVCRKSVLAALEKGMQGISPKQSVICCSRDVQFAQKHQRTSSNMAEGAEELSSSAYGGPLDSALVGAADDAAGKPHGPGRREEPQPRSHQYVPVGDLYKFVKAQLDAELHPVSRSVTYADIFWRIYGILTWHVCGACGEVFSLAELESCRAIPEKDWESHNADPSMGGSAGSFSAPSAGPSAGFRPVLRHCLPGHSCPRCDPASGLPGVPEYQANLVARVSANVLPDQMKIKALGISPSDYRRMTASQRLVLVLEGRNGLRNTLEALTVPRRERRFRDETRGPGERSKRGSIDEGMSKGDLVRDERCVGQEGNSSTGGGTSTDGGNSGRVGPPGLPRHPEYQEHQAPRVPWLRPASPRRNSLSSRSQNSADGRPETSGQQTEAPGGKTTSGLPAGGKNVGSVLDEEQLGTRRGESGFPREAKSLSVPPVVHQASELGEKPLDSPLSDPPADSLPGPTGAQGSAPYVPLRRTPSPKAQRRPARVSPRLLQRSPKASPRKPRSARQAGPGESARPEESTSRAGAGSWTDAQAGTPDPDRPGEPGVSDAPGDADNPDSLVSQDSDSVDDDIPTEIFSRPVGGNEGEPGELDGIEGFEGPDGPGGDRSRGVRNDGIGTDGLGLDGLPGALSDGLGGSDDALPDVYTSLKDSHHQLVLPAAEDFDQARSPHGPRLSPPGADGEDRPLSRSELGQGADSGLGAEDMGGGDQEMQRLVCALASQAGDLRESQRPSKRAFPRLTARYMRYVRVKGNMGREQRRAVLLEIVHEEEVQRAADLRTDLLQARAARVKRARIGFEDAVFPVNNFHYSQNSADGF